MKPGSEENNIIKEYLLGTLKDKVKLQQIEEKLMLDDDFSDQLLVAEDNLIEEYLDGDLTVFEKKAFLESFLISPERQRELAAIRSLKKYAKKQVETKKTEKEPNRKSRVKTIFASIYRFPVPVVVCVLLITGLSFFLVWNFYFRSSANTQAIASLNKAYKLERPFDSRITRFDYAPYNNATRGAANQKIDLTERNRAERIILDDISEKSNAENLHSLGRLYLAKGDFDEAINQLQKAHELYQSNAEILSDIGTAYLEKSKSIAQTDGGQSFELSTKALENLEKAITINPKLPEAQFNRALSLQNLKLPNQAKEAWEEYLKLDSNSQWAEEARINLKSLAEMLPQSKTDKEILQDYLAAARKNDKEQAYQIISRNREMIAGKLVPQQLAFLFLMSKGAKKQEYLSALDYAGKLEREKSSDAYFTQIARFYSLVSEVDQITLRQAQVAVKNGYEYCLQNKFRDALAEFTAANLIFQKMHDIEEAKLCEYWIAYCEFQNDELAKSSELLGKLIEYCQQKNYKWLLSHAYYWLSINSRAAKEISKSIRYAEMALKFAEATTDLYNTQKSYAWLADLNLEVNQFRNSYKYLNKSLTLDNYEEASLRQRGRSFDIVARLFYAQGLYAAAIDVEKEMMNLYQNEIQDVSFERVGYANLGKMYAVEGDFNAARSALEKSKQISETLTDEKVKQKAVAFSILQLANLERTRGNCNDASEYYNQSIQIYKSMEFQPDRYEALKGHLMCEIGNRDNGVIQAEISEVMQLFEDNRRQITEEQNRNSFFDSEQSVYDLAINYEITTGNYEKAFDYSEESRSRSLLDLMRNGVDLSPDLNELEIKNVTKPLSLAELRQKLPREIQIVQYAVLSDKIVIWLINNERTESITQVFSSDTLHTQVSAFLEAIKNKDQAKQNELGRSFYELLIQPLRDKLDPGRQICIIPDKELSYLPFPAFVSTITNNYLVKDYLISYAPSTNVFLAATENAQTRNLNPGEKILSIGNPSFSHQLYDKLPNLPDAEWEARTITKFYESSTLLLKKNATKEAIEQEMQQADVIHYAGHYVVNEQSPLLSSFLVSGEADDSNLQNYELFKNKLQKPRLIVLSACQTAIESFYKGEGMIGAGRTFLALGVPLVVASQWQVDSQATAELMEKFHQHRKLENLSTASALQRAQIEMLNNPNENYRQPFYWAGFLTLGGETQF